MERERGERRREIPTARGHHSLTQGPQDALDQMGDMLSTGSSSPVLSTSHPPPPCSSPHSAGLRLPSPLPFLFCGACPEVHHVLRPWPRGQSCLLAGVRVVTFIHAGGCAWTRAGGPAEWRWRGEPGISWLFSGRRRKEEEGQLLADVCEPGGWVPISTQALAPRGKEVSSHLPGSFSADSAYLPHTSQDRERCEQERPWRKTRGRSLLPKCQLGRPLPPTAGAGVNHPGFWMARAHAVDRGAGISMRQPRLADAEVNSRLCWRDLS